VGLRLISDGLDFLGRLALAFLAALSLACLASRETLHDDGEWILLLEEYNFMMLNCMCEK